MLAGGFFGGNGRWVDGKNDAIFGSRQAEVTIAADLPMVDDPARAERMPAKKKKVPPKKKTAPEGKGAEVARAAKVVAGRAAAVAGAVGKMVASAFSIPKIGPKKKVPAKKAEAKKKAVKLDSESGQI